MKMWVLYHLLFILCIALSFVTDAAVIHLSGYQGTDFNVSCSYDQGYQSYQKYLCRNDCGDSDVLITTSETKKNKYSIYDDKKTRTVTTTISDLQSNDAGKYWCGVTRTGKDIYTEVRVSVVEDSCCDGVTKLQSYDGGSVSISCTYESKYQNNLKYMCRGKQPSTCLQQAVITSDSKQTTQFTLTDDRKSKFTVDITNLTPKDSGSYLCGVHRNAGLDVFSAVELEVKEWCCVKSNNMSGFVGHPVTLQCPYPPQHHNNRKFLCKGDHRKTCTDMVKSQSQSIKVNQSNNQSRFTLQEDVSSSSFSVTITELEAGDAGTYWCGSDSQWSPANYTKIQLSVVSLQETSTVKPVTSLTSNITKHINDAAHFRIWVYILPVTLTLFLIFVLMMVFKNKVCKIQGSGVSVNTPEIQVATRVNSIYGLHEVEQPEMGSSNPHSMLNHDGDAGHGEQDVYQNVHTVGDN